MSKKIEYGDFQTPLPLAKKCVDIISSYYAPNYIIEPTCGLGHFLEASYRKWENKSFYIGYEINASYLKQFEKRSPEIFKKMQIKQMDFFTLDLCNISSTWKKPLIIGNPPWVTNSQLGVLDSNNLPQKINTKGLSGFEAISGKSNFDISEWIIFNLSNTICRKLGILAMLCKTIVARNIFLQNYKLGQKNVGYKIYKIDSKKSFGVSVNACLFVIDYFNGGNETKCDIYNTLDSIKPQQKIGIVNNKIVSNPDLYTKTENMVSGASNNIWRSGIKHDASKVMELKEQAGVYINGYGEKVNIEKRYLYPLLKSSDLANNRLDIKRYVIVTQKKIGENTIHLKKNAPLLWNYLEKHSKKLDSRKSSIYKKQPRFSIFGIGEYSFKSYKIAISGLYKKINFCLLKPHKGKPIMVDDTCYILSFDSLEIAQKTIDILKSELVTKYISSLIFLDSKRPVNSGILQSVDYTKIDHFENSVSP